MTKYRIKVIVFKDGSKAYFPQTLVITLGLSEHWQYIRKITYAKILTLYGFPEVEYKLQDSDLEIKCNSQKEAIQIIEEFKIEREKSDNIMLNSLKAIKEYEESIESVTHINI